MKKQKGQILKQAIKRIRAMFRRRKNYDGITCNIIIEKPKGAKNDNS